MFICVVVSGFFAQLVRARLFLQGGTKTLETGFAVLVALYSLCITCLDVISTCWFVQYVKQSAHALKKQVCVRVRSAESKNITTNMGTVICVCYVILVILFIASRVLTHRIPQDWIMVCLVICSLWKLMKLKLDKQTSLDNPKIVSSHAMSATVEIAPENTMSSQS
jgi:hypothetical protein